MALGVKLTKPMDCEEGLEYFWLVTLCILVQRETFLKTPSWRSITELLGHYMVDT